MKTNRVAKELNDYVFLSPHEGRTAEFFQSRRLSRREKNDAMNGSISLLLKIGGWRNET